MLHTGCHNTRTMISSLSFFFQSTNIGSNPVYDTYNNTTESTRMLSQEPNEEQELSDNGLAIKYFGTHDVSNSRKKAFA